VDPSGRGVHTWRTPDGQVIAYGCTCAGTSWMQWPGVATFRFAPGDPFLTAFPLPGVSDALITDVYRRGVLPMALQALGREALHASAVLSPAGVVAFAARSHTGKSTVAYGLSRRGFPQWADDGVVLEIEMQTARAVPLPFDVRLRAESSGAFGLDEAREARFRQFAPEHAVKADEGTAPLAAIVLLERDPELATPTSSVTLAPTDAFAAVLVHAHEFNPFDTARRRRMLEAYLELVSMVPVRVVRFRPGFEHFDRVLDAVADTIGGAVADLQVGPGVANRQVRPTGTR
jgi:hypothetical protein